jgi:hypothetical protein
MWASERITPISSAAKTQIGLADLECISDIRIDRRLQRITQPEIHLGAPKVSAEVAT